MKQFSYIFLIALIFSCSNAENKKHFDNSSNLNTINDNNTKKFNTHKYEGIATQKLKEYMELLKLQEKHIELKKDIDIQLRALSEGRIIKKENNTIIEDIHQIGTIEKISDSIDKITLTYTSISETIRKKDSIHAIIKRSSFIVDGKKVISNKVFFSIIK